MKKNLLLVLALFTVGAGIFIVACEKHKDPFSAQNVKPAIAEFRFKSDNVLPNGRTDSLKFKAGTSYKLYLRYDDPEFSNSTTRKLQAIFSFESGGGKISHDQFSQPSADGLTFGAAPGKFDGDLLFVPDTSGVVRVKLQLSDGVKISDVPQASATFFENLKPIPDFTIQPRNQTNPYEFSFDPARSQDRDGTISKFVWMFGDNSKPDTVLNNSSITHKYTRAGQYFVRLKLIDNEGKADSTERPVTTANQPPQAALNVFPQNGKVPLQITYNASGSFDPDGNISSYQVFFGDGATAQTPTGTHTFATDLNYQVLLIVKDNLGLADTANVPVRVSTPPTASLKITPETGGPIPLKLVVSGKDSRDPHPGGNITVYRITITNITNNSQLVFPQDSVTTTLTTPANYLIRLDVTNNRGLSSFAEKVIPAGLPGIILPGDEPLFRKP